MLTRRLALVTLVVAALLCASESAAPARAKVASHPDYVPGEIVVGYGASTEIAHTTRMLGATAGTSALESSTRIVKVSRGRSIWPEIAKLRRQRGVLYAVPNYIAHQAGGWIPNDPGNTHHRQGWRKLQWNFLAKAGIDAPAAWTHMFRVHRPGGRGVTIAVLDTGVAYRDWGSFREAPDFTDTKFVDPYDFVAKNPFPLDREGHGTFVTGMIAESTNNGFGLTGLAYGATIMPVRVLDADGNGDSVTIGKGIRYAVAHGAQVINLSLEFDKRITASDIPAVINAIGFAHRHGVVVVAAAGNDSDTRLAYPAAARSVISVGATTRDRCLADYSNVGSDLDLVAPGGGDDATLSDDPDCHPFRTLPPVHQMTFQDLDSLTPGANATRFGYPGTYGTSMAAPAVSATAALVIASGVIGRHPSPDRVLNRLEQTATPLGGAARPNDEFGWGLVNAGAATAPGPPKPQ
ncbi:MAG TPA: S8 family serine peptidase [Solirubrobacteraceae bacterium]|nr:S8 family serine peptidase [Solirubrobacteraceae bacterium]